jgi:RNA polymerase sigma-70 factor, ECF subfamily
VSSTPNEVFTGDAIDFGGVASRYFPMLYGIALRRLRNVQDAEDAVQDALLSAYKHVGQFEGRSQLSTWLTRIVINVTRMKLRSRPRHQVVSLDQHLGDDEATLANELADAGPNPEAICAHTEMEETLHKALANISPRLRLAFHMREISGFSAKETADALRITASSLKSRVTRARAAVGAYLDEARGTNLADQSKRRTVNRSCDSRGRKNSRAHRRRHADCCSTAASVSLGGARVRSSRQQSVQSLGQRASSSR